MKSLLTLGAALGAVCLSPAHGAEPRDEEYTAAVAETYGFAAGIPHMFAWCRKKFPDVGPSLDEPLKKWQGKYAGLVDELERRLQVIIVESGEFSADQHASALGELRKQLAAQLDEKLAGMTEDQAMLNCKLLPVSIEGASMDIDKRYGETLRLIRGRDAPPADKAR